MWFPMWIVWLVVMGGFLVAELNTGTFYMLLLAGGAVVGLIFALLGTPVIVQGLAFVVSSFLFYVFVLPRLKRRVQSSSPPVPTAATVVEQRVGVVRSAIVPPQSGMVEVDGDTWSAVADEPIEVGSRVIVKEVHVTKLYVQKEG